MEPGGSMPRKHSIWNLQNKPIDQQSFADNKVEILYTSKHVKIRSNEKAGNLKLEPRQQENY